MDIEKAIEKAKSQAIHWKRAAEISASMLEKRKTTEAQENAEFYKLAFKGLKKLKSDNVSYEK